MAIVWIIKKSTRHRKASSSILELVHIPHNFDSVTVLSRDFVESSTILDRDLLSYGDLPEIEPGPYAYLISTRAGDRSSNLLIVDGKAESDCDLSLGPYMRQLEFLRSHFYHGPILIFTIDGTTRHLLFYLRLWIMVLTLYRRSVFGWVYRMK